MRAYARCAAHPEKQSGCSSDLWVTVETLTLPDPPLHPGELAAGHITPIGFGGGGSALDHTIEYQLDWGDGTESEWTTDSPLEHAWSAAGAYGLRARVRCQGHPAVVSGWSEALSLSVDAVEAPPLPEGVGVAADGRGDIRGELGECRKPRDIDGEAIAAVAEEADRVADLVEKGVARHRS